MTDPKLAEAPDLMAIRAAAVRIAPYVHRTPVMTSRTVDDELGCKVFFKCENLQKVGAFKTRGATNAVLGLDDEVRGRGVISHSSGNHAAALAYAASIAGVPAVVVMPDTAPQVKVRAVRGYGAEVIPCKQAEREEVCTRVAEERGMTLIHPYQDPNVIAGQGTAALELFEEQPELDAVVTPVGGGGLIAGTTITAKSLRPEAQLFASEPAAVDDAYRSMQTGVRQPAVSDPKTWGDGLLTGLGDVNFAVLRHHGVEVVLVQEDEIVSAARFLTERMKLVVEPSAATVLAALRNLGDRIRDLRVGAILTGGNTDFRWLEREA